MARSAAPPRDTSIQTYRAKRNFAATPEPAPSPSPAPSSSSRKKPSRQADAEHIPMFVVQKHQAHRAGLHWDFRLEHNDVLWSWAVRKGPSLDPADKRVAVHVEDHPLDYANFQGAIPDGQYGAGTVETWDRGSWKPLIDPDQGLRDGEIKFVLSGKRLNGKFTLIRLKAKPDQRGKQDNWLLIKGHDEHEKQGADAEALEAAVEPPANQPRNTKKPTILGAIKAKLPDRQAPQLASVAEGPPEDDDWLTEIKFDGYRILASVDHDAPAGRRVKLLTRNGNDWTDRLPTLAKTVDQLYVRSALLDGELVALDKDGVSSFPALQAALSKGRDQSLIFYLFDLLYLDGWDLRPCALRDRKQRLKGLTTWHGMLRYSDHHEGDASRMRKAACQMRLEGIICKKADAGYQPGRGQDWLKLKCAGREELLIIGWTEPAGSRTGLGALHVGYYDPEGRLHYAGGVGTGFSDDVLQTLRDRLDGLGSAPPKDLMLAGEDLDRGIHWVKPELIAETSFTAWSGAGRIRHAVFLGLREDKAPKEVVRDPADPDAARRAITPKDYLGSAKRKAPIIAVPPRTRTSGADPAPDVQGSLNQRALKLKGVNLKLSSPEDRSDQGVSNRPASNRNLPTKTGPAATGLAGHAVAARTSSAIVTARAPKARTETIEGVTLTHPDRELWPGVTKRDLAGYWQKLAADALPGVAHRPLAIVRCPEGIDGEHFFQKHGHGTMPPGIRDGTADKAPFLVIDDLQGLVAMVQMSAIELHVWGATEADPLHPDQLVFDLDPGEGVKIAEIAAAAIDMRNKLETVGLASFCRTSGGKGLHVVVPLHPEQSWDPTRAWCRSIAESLSQTYPEKYLAHVKIAERRGRILIDWLRNGLGSTAVASFSPRARSGAGVATPLAWKEVSAKLDLAAFTVQTVPDRLARLRADPWADFDKSRQRLPELPKQEVMRKPSVQATGTATIVTAKAPKPRARKS